jgi:adenosylcobinamide-GDP ribazoletransferase
MRLYFIALQFLTIIPLPFTVRCEKEDMGRSMALFPVVGLTIGLFLVGLDYLLGFVFPRPVADLLLITALAAVTGALHLDGLADVCDGLAARGGKERFLAVMKDSRTGAVGVVGLVLGLLLKYQALLHVPPDQKRAALLFFPMVARMAQVQMTVGALRARSDGLGATFVDGAGGVQFAVAYIVTLSTAFLLLGVPGISCCIILYLLTWGLKAWFHRRLGGITGDIIGCASELNEIAALLAILGMAKYL